LGGFSLLSSGLVFAQSETAIDTIVPTTEDPQPPAAAPALKAAPVPARRAAAPEAAQPQPEFSERRARLKQRLRRRTEAAKPAPAPVRRSTPKVEIARPAPARARRSKPKVEVARPAPVVIQEKLKLDITRPAPVVVIQEKPKLEVATPPASRGIVANPVTPPFSDNNNAYIDPTDYSVGTNRNYVAPNAVVLTERKSGCQAVLPQGQGLSSGLCGGGIAQRSNNQRLGNTPTPNGQPASWARKSQAVEVVSIAPGQVNAISINNSTENPAVLPVSAVSANPISIRSNAFRSPIVGQASVRQRSRQAVAVPRRSYRGGRGTSLPSPLAYGNVAPQPSSSFYGNIPLPSIGQLGFFDTGMIFPLSVPTPITSLFGWRTHPISGARRFHAGTDLGAPLGTPVLAAEQGQVGYAEFAGGYGLTVVVNHTPIQQTLYAHLSEIFVQPGEWVEQGTVIGRVGSTGNSTGPHLHFEVRQLTEQGWVATDPGAQLQFALGQLVQALQAAQLPQQPTDQSIPQPNS
jgi:murein DD-endopeptidase MepM/ murein hydrolase activator NlpD